jgi:hypothetical protein
LRIRAFDAHPASIKSIKRMIIYLSSYKVFQIFLASTQGIVEKLRSIRGSIADTEEGKLGTKKLCRPGVEGETRPSWL